MRIDFASLLRQSRLAIAMHDAHVVFFHTEYNLTWDDPLVWVFEM